MVMHKEWNSAFAACLVAMAMIAAPALGQGTARLRVVNMGRAAIELDDGTVVPPGTAAMVEVPANRAGQLAGVDYPPLSRNDLYTLRVKSEPTPEAPAEAPTEPEPATEPMPEPVTAPEPITAPLPVTAPEPTPEAPAEAPTEPEPAPEPVPEPTPETPAEAPTEPEPAPEPVSEPTPEAPVEAPTEPEPPPEPVPEPT
ncbi:MAG: hypothetical protein IKO40_12870, partial [Kiritimatiellae bacterium]|nr:hypothetical protein [Kiritimatiellia bacterium]